MNRLHLNFSLTSSADRTSFVREYLSSPEFSAHPPTPTELETISNYILWGKDKASPLIIKPARKSHDWDDERVISLEELQESPAFSDLALHTLDYPPTLIRKETFSRTEARRNAPPEELAQLEDLWRRIDNLDLVIELYDEAHGKRTKPIRPELLDRFTPPEIEAARTSAAHLNQYTYLHLRHEIIELRREQYTIRDGYQPTMAPPSTPLFYNPPADTPTFGDDIKVYPLGLDYGANNSLSLGLFPHGRMPNPNDFDEPRLNTLVDFIWHDHKPTPDPNELYFDFRNEEHVYKLLMCLDDMEGLANPEDREDTFAQFRATLQFYLDNAELSEVQRELVELKVRKKKNAEICAIINPKYGKKYGENYISTIFKQIVVREITRAAERHRAIAEELVYPENFKTCKDCGRTLLRNSENFVHKAKSTDGFSCRCKTCERAKRAARKEGD